MTKLVVVALGGKQTDRRAGKAGRSRLLASKDADVGTLQSIGYFTTYCLGKQRYVHRIIWEMFNGPIPDKYEIDHIDGVRSNNSISNLRCISRTKNLRNAKMRSTNTSGVTGVCRSGCGWMAIWWTTDKVKKGKYFSGIKLGEDLAFKLACEFRANKLAELSAEGDEYSIRHGQSKH
jgi:hypothetical protein